jgi:arsenate reductase
MTSHVLVLCTHNSARSILAEALLNHHARRLGLDVVGHSAGSSPSGRVNPLALTALARAGIDTAGLRSKSWDEFARPDAPPMRIVITVCDNAARETCPIWPGSPVQVHWGYPDPSAATGSEEVRLAAFERTRQAIENRILQLLELPLQAMDDGALQSSLLDISSRQESRT